MLGYPKGFLLAKHPPGAVTPQGDLPRSPAFGARRALPRARRLPAGSLPAPYLHVEEGGEPLPQIGLGVAAQVPAGGTASAAGGDGGAQRGGIAPLPAAGTPSCCRHCWGRSQDPSRCFARGLADPGGTEGDEGDSHGPPWHPERVRGHPARLCPQKSPSTPPAVKARWLRKQPPWQRVRLSWGMSLASLCPPLPLPLLLLVLLVFAEDRKAPAGRGEVKT